MSATGPAGTVTATPAPPSVTSASCRWQSRAPPCTPARRWCRPEASPSAVRSASDPEKTPCPATATVPPAGTRCRPDGVSCCCVSRVDTSVSVATTSALRRSPRSWSYSGVWLTYDTVGMPWRRRPPHRVDNHPGLCGDGGHPVGALWIGADDAHSLIPAVTLRSSQPFPRRPELGPVGPSPNRPTASSRLGEPRTQAGSPP